jgi:hypothetical protein
MLVYLMILLLALIALLLARDLYWHRRVTTGSVASRPTSSYHVPGKLSVCSAGRFFELLGNKALVYRRRSWRTYYVLVSCAANEKLALIDDDSNQWKRLSGDSADRFTSLPVDSVCESIATRWLEELCAQLDGPLDVFEQCSRLAVDICVAALNVDSGDGAASLSSESRELVVRHCCSATTPLHALLERHEGAATHNDERRRQRLAALVGGVERLAALERSCGPLGAALCALFRVLCDGNGDDELRSAVRQAILSDKEPTQSVHVAECVERALRHVHRHWRPYVARRAVASQPLAPIGSIVLCELPSSHSFVACPAIDQVRSALATLVVVFCRHSDWQPYSPVSTKSSSLEHFQIVLRSHKLFLF